MKVGDVFVDLHLDSKTFNSELNSTLAKAAARARPIKIKVEADTNQFERAMARTLTRKAKPVKVKVDADTRAASKSFQSLSKDMSGLEKDLGKYTGRVRLLADAILALAPAASAVGAVAVPAFTTLAQAAGAASGAAVTAGLAFAGVGKAVKAMSDYGLDPSAANLKKMNIALEKLPPAAQNFARYLHSLGGELDGLRASAAGGFLPGLEKGMKAASARIPEVNGLLQNYSGILGQISEASGKAFASDRWSVLFNFLKSTAGPTLQALATSTGNVAHGAVALVDAFAPLNAGGLKWLTTLTGGFDKWATQLKTTQGFQDFFGYVQQVGPQVATTIGALAQAIVSIGEAAAPLSGAVLSAITGIANVITKVGSSSAGAALLATAVGMRTLARASQVLGPALATANTALLDLRTSPSKAATALGMLKGVASSLRGPAGMAGLVVAATSANKAIGALGGALAGAAAGSLFGPIGAGIGAVVGALGGFISASHNARQAQEQLNQSLSVGGSFAESYAATLDSSTGKQTAATAQLLQSSDVFKSAATAVQQYGITREEVFAASQGDTAAQMKIDQAFAGQQAKISQEANSLDAHIVARSAEKQKAYNAEHDAYTNLLKGVDSGNQSWQEAVKWSQKFTDQSNLTTAQMATQRAAIASAMPVLDQLNGSYKRSAEQSQELAQTLFSEGDARQKSVDSNIAYQQAIDDTNKSIQDNTKHVKANQDSLSVKDKYERQNLQSLNALSAAGKGYVQSLVEQGAGTEKVKKATADVRKEFIASARDAGLSKSAASALADSYGLIPKEVSTKINIANQAFAAAAVADLTAKLQALPPEVRSKVMAIYERDGADAAQNFLDKYDGQIATAQLTVQIDQAQTKVSEAEAELARLQGLPTSPKVDADITAAQGKLATAKTELDTLNVQKANPKLDVDSGAFRDKLKTAGGDVKTFDQLHPKAKLDADDRASKKAKTAANNIKDAGKAKGTGKVDVKDDASKKAKTAANNIKNAGKAKGTGKVDVKDDASKKAKDAGGKVKDVSKAKGKGKIDADDKASAKAKAANKAIQSVKGKTVAIHVTSNASSAASSAQGSINSVHGKTVTITVNTVKKGGAIGGKMGAHELQYFDTGGKVFQGTRTPQADDVNARLSYGEWVTQKSAVDYYGDKIMTAINNRQIPKEDFEKYGYAVGGMAGQTGYAKGGVVKKPTGLATIKDWANGMKGALDGSALFKKMANLVQANYTGNREKIELKTLATLERLGKSQDLKQAQLKTATEARDKAVAGKESFASGFSDRQGANVLAFGSSPGGIAGGLHAQLGAFRTFAANLAKLKTMGYPAALIQQVAEAGLEEGLAASNALISANAMDQQSIKSDFAALNLAASSTATSLSNQFFDATIAANTKEMSTLNSQLATLNKQIAGQVSSIGKRQARNVKKHDSGGWLPVGDTLVTNQTGKPEPVLNAQQWDDIHSMVQFMKNGSTSRGSGAPLIGHADIHTEVDLERYERERAFRERAVMV